MSKLYNASVVAIVNNLPDRCLVRYILKYLLDAPEDLSLQILQDIICDRLEYKQKKLICYELINCQVHQSLLEKVESILFPKTKNEDDASSEVEIIKSIDDVCETIAIVMPECLDTQASGVPLNLSEEEANTFELNLDFDIEDVETQLNLIETQAQKQLNLIAIEQGNNLVIPMTRCAGLEMHEIYSIRNLITTDVNLPLDQSLWDAAFKILSAYALLPENEQNDLELQISHKKQELYSDTTLSLGKYMEYVINLELLEQYIVSCPTIPVTGLHNADTIEL